MNETVMDKVWDLITNTEVLEVNQAYFGDSGGVYEMSEEMVSLTDAHIESRRHLGAKDVHTSSYQHLYKPIGDDRVAVLLMNSDNTTQNLSAKFSNVPGLSCSQCKVRDIWNHKDLGTFTDVWSGDVGSHDAAFLVISPA